MLFYVHYNFLSTNNIVLKFPIYYLLGATGDAVDLTLRFIVMSRRVSVPPRM
jgi:hypothetical protein